MGNDGSLLDRLLLPRRIKLDPEPTRVILRYEYYTEHYYQGAEDYFKGEYQLRSLNVHYLKGFVDAYHKNEPSEFY